MSRTPIRYNPSTLAALEIELSAYIPRAEVKLKVKQVRELYSHFKDENIKLRRVRKYLQEELAKYRKERQKKRIKEFTIPLFEWQ